jgi:hypothetical protein
METLTAHNCGIDIAYQHFGSSGGQVFQHVQFGYLASLCPATNRLQSRPSPPHTRKVTGSKPAGTTPICAGQHFLVGLATGRDRLRPSKSAEGRLSAW